jgi:hypothetical protein
VLPKFTCSFPTTSCFGTCTPHWDSVLLRFLDPEGASSTMDVVRSQEKEQQPRGYSRHSDWAFLYQQVLENKI